MRAWCRGLTISWTSPRPFGVGTTRQVGVFGALQADERYFLWEEGRRQAFHITRANLPLFKRFGEYYDIEPRSDTTCRFTWKVAAEPTLSGGWVRPETRC
ncbi:SRPBCC family protein [Streptomyces sp. Tu102]|nr:SRPBCC family protein [Streptomyces sp. Tu102]